MGRKSMSIEREWWLGVGERTCK